MSFLMYIVGLLVLVGGLVWAASTAGIPELYIGIGVVIILGLGIMSAVTQTRRRDPSAGEDDSVTVVKH